MPILDVDPSQIAIGLLIGSVFWMYALLRYFPKKFDNAETRIEEKVDAKVEKGINDFLKRFSDPDDQDINMMVAHITGRAFQAITQSEAVAIQLKPFITHIVENGIVTFEERLGLDANTIKELVERLNALIPKNQGTDDQGGPGAFNPMQMLMGFMGGGGFGS